MRCARLPSKSISPPPTTWPVPDGKLKDRAEETGGRLATVVADLLDLDDGRIAAMDAARIDMQALSLTSPGVEQLPVEEAKVFARASQRGDRGSGPAPS